MSEFLKYEIYRGRPMIRFTRNPIISIKSFYNIFEAALEVTGDTEVTILNHRDSCVTISVHTFTKLKFEDNDGYVYENFYTSGVFVNTEEQANELANKFEEIRMWNLLKN